MKYIAGNNDGGLESFLCSIPDRWHAQYFEWSTEPPTEPGLYRVYHKNVEGKIQMGDWETWTGLTNGGNGILYIDNESYELLSEHIRADIEDGYKTYWLGPLPVPAPPAESE